MADEETKPAVTDSRFPGFDPEVEASHAEAAAAAQQAATQAAADLAAASAPPVPTHRCGGCGALHLHAMDVCPSCGASGLVFSMNE
jgi:rubrerythrin